MYKIPEKLEAKLSRLKPYTTDTKIKSKKQYILNYFYNNAPATYYKSNIMQCSNSRRRSPLDIYFLTKARFKSTTFKEVLNILFNPECPLHAIFCLDVENIVLNYPRWGNFSIKTDLKILVIMKNVPTRSSKGYPSLNEMLEIINYKLDK